MKTFLNVLRIFLKALFFLLSFGLIAVAIFWPSLLKDAIEWLQGVVNTLGRRNRPLSFWLGFIESVPLLGMSVPGQNALFVIGGFVAQAHWFAMIGIVSCAVVLGDIVGYTIGRYQGEKFITRFGKYFGVGKTEVHYMGRGLDKYGARAIILSKWNGYARGIVPFIAGTSKMKRSTFLRFTISGSILYAAMFITLARIFVGYYQNVIPYIRWIMIGILLIGGLYLWFFKRDSLKRYMRDKEKEIEEAEELITRIK